MQKTSYILSFRLIITFRYLHARSLILLHIFRNTRQRPAFVEPNSESAM
jgi:hypothetical protein